MYVKYVPVRGEKQNFRLYKKGLDPQQSARGTKGERRMSVKTQRDLSPPLDANEGDAPTHCLCPEHSSQTTSSR